MTHVCLLLAISSATPNPSVDALRPGQTQRVGREGPQAHGWRATAGQYFQVLLEPEGSPLDMRLLAPSGSEIAEVVNPTGELRGLSLSAIAYPFPALFALL